MFPKKKTGFCQEKNYKDTFLKQDNVINVERDYEKK